MKAMLCLVLSLALVSTASACPFCAPGTTLMTELSTAQFVVFGTLKNPVRDPKNFGSGSTTLEIEIVVKDNAFLKGKKELTIPRYIPVDPKNEKKHMIFCDIYNGQLDAYRGEEVPKSSNIAQYLKEALSLQQKPIQDKLEFYFKHFTNDDWAVSSDAYQEYSNAEYKDVSAAAKKVDPDVIWKLLNDPNTSKTRFGLLGLMLGHCAKPEKYAPMLEKFISETEIKKTTGYDGLLAGLIILDKARGVKLAKDILSNDKEEFIVRYAALRTLRFFWDYRSDLLDQKEVVKMCEVILEQPDIADFTIEDYRKWNQWQYAEKITKLFNKESHQIILIQRSIIKYALSAPPGNTICKEFIETVSKNPEFSDRVKDIRELLELEKAPPAKKEEPAKP